MDEKVKIVVTAPEDAADAVREAMGQAGAGRVGEYSFCSFSIRGVGRFLLSDEANPYEEPAIDIYPLLD